MIFLIMMLLSCGSQKSVTKKGERAISINTSMNQNNNNNNSSYSNSLIPAYINRVENIDISDDNSDNIAVDNVLKELMLQSLREFKDKKTYISINIEDDSVKEEIGKDNITPLDSLHYLAVDYNVFKEIVATDDRYLKEDIIPSFFKALADFTNDDKDITEARKIIDYYSEKSLGTYFLQNPFSTSEQSAIEMLIKGMSTDPNDNGWTINFINKYQVNIENVIPSIIDIAVEYENDNSELFENTGKILLTFLNDQAFKKQYDKEGIFKIKPIQYAVTRNKVNLVRRLFDFYEEDSKSDDILKDRYTMTLYNDSSDEVTVINETLLYYAKSLDYKEIYDFISGKSNQQEKTRILRLNDKLTLFP